MLHQRRSVLIYVHIGKVVHFNKRFAFVAWLFFV